MAFDLNKNDKSNKDSSVKNPTKSKFNLSKEQAENVVIPENVIAPENSSKSKNLILGLIGILIVGGGIWYYSTQTKTTNTDLIAATEVAPVSTDTTIATASPSKVNTDVVNTNAADTENAIATVDPVVAGQGTSTGVPTEITALNHKVPATFAHGSSSFATTDQSLIKRVISYLTKNPAASIYVDGYASSDGSSEINQALSQARADSFKKYLVSRNIDKSRIVTLGKGIENPIASNKSSAGRKKNRRIEITLH